MKTIPRGIVMKFLELNVPPARHVELIGLMAAEGDWYAVHWQSCGLMEGVLASRMCRNGHQPSGTELDVAQVRELAEGLLGHNDDCSPWCIGDHAPQGPTS